MHAIELAREAGGDLAHEGADEVRPWRRGSHGRREGRGGEGKGRLATGWRMARDAHATVSVTSLIPFFFFLLLEATERKWRVLILQGREDGEEHCSLRLIIFQPKIE